MRVVFTVTSSGSMPSPGFARAAPGLSAVVVPDTHLLFHAHFSKVGLDLVLTGEHGERFVVIDYYAGSARPALRSPGGAMLGADTVEHLAGPVQPGAYAQAGTPAAAAAIPAIGRVDVATGTVQVVRAGVTVTLAVGDPIQRGDVVQTGSNSVLAITFIDGTAFHLDSGARMVINELVYSDGGSNNTALLSLVQGGFSFLAGLTAKTGEMRVETPLATLGIRGTGPRVTLAADGNDGRYCVMKESDGRVGSYDLLDRADPTRVLATVNADDLCYRLRGSGGAVGVEATPKTPQEQQVESALVVFLTPLAASPPQLDNQQQLQQQGPQPNGPTGPAPNPQNGGPGGGGGGGGGSSGPVPGDGNGGSDAPAQRGAAGESSSLAGGPGGTAITQPLPATDPTVITASGGGPEQAGGTTTPVSAPIIGSSAPLLVSDTQSVVSSPTTVAVAAIIQSNGIGGFEAIVPGSTTTTVVQAPATLPAGITTATLASYVQTDAPANAITYDRGNFAFLAQGEGVTYAVSFTAVVNGTPRAETVTVVIAGQNDAPVLTPDAPTSVTVPVTVLASSVPATSAPAQAAALVTDTAPAQTDQTAQAASTPVASGTMSFKDLDNNDTHKVTVSHAAGTTGTLSIAAFQDSSSAAPGTFAWIYTPDAGALAGLSRGQTRTETFVVTLADSQGATAQQTLSITLEGTNTAPVVAGPATLTSGTEDQQQPILITAAQLLARATDADGNTLSVASLAVEPGKGVLTDLGGGSWSFLPGTNVNGPVGFSYTVSDGIAAPVAATASLSLQQVDDLPTGSVLVSGSAAVGQVLAADTSTVADADGLGTLAYQWLRGGSAIAGATQANYTVAAGDAGQALSLRVSYVDGSGNADSLTSAPLTIGANNAPVLAGPAALTSGTEDQQQPILITAAQLLARATDADGNTLSVASLAVEPGKGVLTDLGGGSWSFVPGANVNGPVGFTYTVSDGIAAPVAATASLSLQQVDDLPTGSVLVSGSAAVGQVLAADTTTVADADGLGVLAYQWLRGGNVIADATQATYQVSNLDVGSAVSVRISYVDGSGNADSLTSAGTALVTGISSLTGGPGPDTLTGTGGADTIYGGAGDDSLSGGTGRDTLYGVAGNDTLNGGADFDIASYRLDAAAGGTAGIVANMVSNTVVDGFGTVDTLVGVEAIEGTNAGDTMIGGGADTNFFGRAGNDSASGGPGFNHFEPGAGNDTFAGGSGTNELSYEDYVPASNPPLGTPTPGVAINLGAAVNGVVTISDPFGGTDVVSGVSRLVGTNYDDTLTGDGGNNVFAGLAGRDSIDGGGGIDRLDYRKDQQFGGLGGAIVNNSAAPITVLGVTLAAGQARDGFGTVDTFTSIEQLIGTAVADYFQGGTGTETFLGGGGADTIIGGGGADVAAYWSSGAAIQLDLQTPANNQGDAAGDAFVGISRFNGSSFDDTMTGAAGDDNVYGDLGNDVIDGGAGNDSLSGAEGNDRISGGIGDDFLDGGAGSDTLDGGVGNDDIVWYGASSAAVMVDLGAGTGSGGDAAGDVLVGLEHVIGSSFADTLIGDGADNVLAGGLGSDSLDGRAGDDGLDGADGNDTLQGGAGNDVLLGGAGNDSLDGGTEDDVLFGGAGNDTLVGGGGTDTAQFAFDGLPLGTLSRVEQAGKITIVLTPSAGGTAISLFELTAVADGVLVTDLRAGSPLGSDVVQGSVEFLDFFATDVAGPGSILELAFPTITSTGSASQGGAGNDSIAGTLFADSLNGGLGNDTLAGLGGPDTLAGGGGNDVVDYSGDAAFAGGGGAIVVNLAAGTATDGFGSADVLTGFVGVIGGAAGDTLIGDGAGNTLVGNGGNDSLDGGAGNDVLAPGAGADTVLGGTGTNQVSYADAPGSLRIDLNTVVNGFVQVTDPWGSTDRLQNIDRVRGTAFADSITGDTRDNVFYGLDGADTVVGGGGNDRVSYVRDATYGGTGSVVVNLDSANHMAGGATILAGSAIDGFGKTDTLVAILRTEGTTGSDTMWGGSGSNWFYGNGGGDSIDGGSGTDWVAYNNVGTAVFVNMADNSQNAGGALNDRYANIEGLQGTAFNDTIIGNASNNRISGLAGDDSLVGGGGTDRVSYGNDDDNGATHGVLVNLATGTATDGFGGHDTISGFAQAVGTPFSDTLIGSSANNLFFDEGGSDSYDGGAGNDRVSYIDASAPILIDLANPALSTGDAAGDRFTSIETIEGSTFADTFQGGAADDVFVGNGGGDSINGGAGFNTAAYYNAATLGVVADLLGTFTNTNDAAGDRYVNIQELDGTSFGDSLYGDNARENFLWGGAGNDLLVGRGGYDGFSGGTGNDTIDGTPIAADAPAANDLDYDRAYYQGTNDPNPALGIVATLATVAGGTGSVVDLTGTFGTDTLIDIEEISATMAADTLVGGDPNNANYEGFFGLGGNDLINGGGGFDEARYDRDERYGALHGAVVNLSASTISVSIPGETVNGLLSGHARDGFGGDDTLVSIEGVRGTGLADYALGGSGDERFIMLDGNDTIDGGGGFDFATYATDPATHGILANLSGNTLLFPLEAGAVTVLAGTIQDDYSGVDVVANIEGVYGTRFADYIMGSAASNNLVGNGGDDWLAGGAGNDTLDGGSGSDGVYYGLDTQLTPAPAHGVIANLGTAAVTGTVGGITATVAANSAFDDFGNTDTFISIENVTGTSFADILAGSSGSNTLDGFGGSDTLTGGLGSDTFYFDRMAGAAVITDFHVAEADGVQIDGIFASAAALQAAMAEVARVVNGVSETDVDITHGTDTITLRNTTLASLQVTSLDATGTNLLVH